MRGRQVTRLLRLARLLARPGGISASEATSELDCVRRTFYRDLQALEDLCYPVYSEPDGGAQRYHLRPEFRVQHRLPFTHEELTALWLARGALGSLDGTPFGTGAHSLLEKVEGALSDEVRRRVERAQETLAVTPPGRRYAARAAIVEALRRAAEERRTVELSYSPLDGRRARRRIDPYLIWFDPRAEALYVAGHAHDRRALRTFLVDRVTDPVITGETFTPPADWSPEHFLTDTFAAFDGPATTVRLSFTGRAARLVAERTWHPTQTLVTRPGGRAELTMRVPLSPGLTGWVLSWTPEVTVLSPAALARDVTGALEEGLRSMVGRKRGVARASGTLDVTSTRYPRRAR